MQGKCKGDDFGHVAQYINKYISLGPFEGVILSCSKFRLGSYHLVFLEKYVMVRFKRCSNVSFAQVSRSYYSEATNAIIDNNFMGRIKARVDMRKRALHHMWIHSGGKGHRHGSGCSTKKHRHMAFESGTHIDSMCKNITGDGIVHFIVKSLDQILTAKDPRKFKKLVIAPDQASENES